MAVSKTALDAHRLAKQTGKRVEKPIPGNPGLYAVAQPSGAASWAFRYRRPTDGKAAKLTLGPLSNDTADDGPPIIAEPEFGEPLDVDAAKVLAERCRLMLKRKIDPATFVRQQAEEARDLERAVWEGHLFDTLVVEFLKHYPPVRAGRPATANTVQQTAFLLGLKPDGKGGWQPTGNGVLSKWQGKVFSDRDGTPRLTRKAAFDILEKMKPVTANRTLTALKLFGRWAVEREYVTANPFSEMRKPNGEEPRDRTLTAEEIGTLWQVVEAADPGSTVATNGRIAQLVLVTGQRPGEVREVTWDEFDFAEREWTIPKRRTKNRKADHVVPLTPLALEVLAAIPKQGPFVFGREGGHRPVGKEPAKLKFGKLMAKGRQPWTFHDLRRTAYTAMAEDFTYVVADMVTNHAAPKMAQTYGSGASLNRFKWEALDAWAKRLEGIISKPPQSTASTQRRVDTEHVTTAERV